MLQLIEIKAAKVMATVVCLAEVTDREVAVADDDKLQLRLWLRLLTCTEMIEARIRNHLRLEFGTTLPRFDVLAQLDATGRPMSMGDLSARLMVTSGNVTALVGGMVADGLITRVANPSDRRGRLIAMTPTGRALFDRMAPAHQRWIDAAMAGLSRAEMVVLLKLGARLKQSVRAAERG